MKYEQRALWIRERLTKALQPISLEITDDSHKHVGHAGALTGMGHFSIKISSPLLEGLPLIQQHRLIYNALGDLMITDIHALQIEIL
ncbi:MAG: BolA family transcriptional regulator [Pseudomonadota bacterium]|nr:BolA family transcriptional regulator [Pseudomonadota bacterium]